MIRPCSTKEKALQTSSTDGYFLTKGFNLFSFFHVIHCIENCSLSQLHTYAQLDTTKRSP